jgi:hypothetical protein
MKEKHKPYLIPQGHKFRLSRQAAQLSFKPLTVSVLKHISSMPK